MKLFFTCVLLLVAIAIYAQQNLPDSTQHLQEVEILGNRLRYFSSGNKIEVIDSSVLERHRSNTLAELLASESQGQVLNYGTGLATASVRGMSTAHTSVLWNGISIVSPLYGVMDFNLVPSNFLGSVKLQSGGAGALWGSGAVGGTIHLNNAAVLNQGFVARTTLSLGSFHDQQQNIELGISKKRFAYSVKYFHHQAQNNFPYSNIAVSGSPIQRLANAELAQQGVLQEFTLQLSTRQRLSLRSWYQFNDRNLPANILSKEGTANQKDEFTRSMAEWQYTRTRYTITARSAYFHEYLAYTDPAISLNSKARSNVWVNEVESKIKISATQFVNLGVNSTINSASSNNYLNNPNQYRTAFLASYRLNNKKNTIRGTTSIRQEFVSTGQRSFTASLGLEGWLWRILRLRTTLAKNYRLPTFNDLYWTPGGNPDLKPEQGWSEELGLALIHCGKHVAIETELATFSNQVEQMIQWQPMNNSIWSPMSIMSVWARGIEYDLKTYFTWNKLQVQLGLKYQFVKSTTEKTSEAQISTLHKYVIYVPQEKILTNASISYSGLRVAWLQSYMGYRYTIADNTQYLPPFKVSSIELSKKFSLTNISLRPFLQINNLWDVSYQTIAYYPMPGRNFQAGISVDFHKPNVKPIPKTN